MVEKIAIKLVIQLKKEKLINSNNEKLYLYTLNAMIEQSITVVTILLLAGIFKDVFPTICFLTFFLLLRKWTGGYHTKHFVHCYVLTILTYIGVTKIVQVMLPKMIIVYFLLFISVIVIYIIGTVNHPNIAMTMQELKKVKRIARDVLVIEVVTVIVFILLGLESVYIAYMSFAIILCAISLCIAKILKQEV